MRTFFFLAVLLLTILTAFGQRYKDIPLASEKTLREILNKTQQENNVGKEIYTLYFLAENAINKFMYREAEIYLLRAISKIEDNNIKKVKKTIRDRYTILDSYDELARYYNLINDDNKARQMLNQSDSLRFLLFGKKSIFRVKSKIMIADMLLEEDKHEEATKIYEQALFDLNASATTSFTLNDLMQACYLGLAKAYLKQGNTQKAKKYFTNSLKFDVGALGILPKNVASLLPGLIEPQNLMSTPIYINPKSLDLMSQISITESNLDLAETSNRIAMLQSNSSPELMRQLIKTKVIIQLEKKEHSGAFESLDRLLGNYLTDIQKNFQALNDREKENYFTKLSRDFDFYISLAVTNPIDSIRDRIASSLFNFQLNTKGLILDEYLKQRKILKSISDSSLHQMYDELMLSKAALSNFVYSKNADISKKVLLEAKIDSLEKKFAHNFAHTDTTDRYSWENVKEYLKEGESLIELKRFTFLSAGEFQNGTKPPKDSILYLAFIVKDRNAKSVKLKLIPDGNSLEKGTYNYYRNAIASGQSTELPYTRYWMPVRDEIDGSKVVFSGDGVFNLINLYTLRNPETKQYVSDEVSITLLNRSKELAQSKSNAGEKRTALLIGAPSFNLKDQAPVSQNTNRNIEDFSQIIDQQFAELPGTEREINNIGHTLESNTWNVQAYTHNDATEDAIKNTNSPLLIHLATHGFFLASSDSNINPMLRSGLVFAGVENKEKRTIEDGILTAQEVATLDLSKTELVVLSACETGLGEFKNGEGVYGIQRAFTLAGVQQIIMSLWKVDDTATQQLMSFFYENLMLTNNVSQSFVTAQQKLRKTYPEPRYWGAFQLIGTTNHFFSDSALFKSNQPEIVTEISIKREPQRQKVLIAIPKFKNEQRKYSEGENVQITLMSSAGNKMQYNGILGEIYDSHIRIDNEDFPLSRIMAIGPWNRSLNFMSYLLTIGGGGVIGAQGPWPIGAGMIIVGSWLSISAQRKVSTIVDYNFTTGQN